METSAYKFIWKWCKYEFRQYIKMPKPQNLSYLVTLLCSQNCLLSIIIYLMQVNVLGFRSKNQYFDSTAQQNYSLTPQAWRHGGVQENKIFAPPKKK